MHIFLPRTDRAGGLHSKLIFLVVAFSETGPGFEINSIAPLAINPQRSETDVF